MDRKLICKEDWGISQKRIEAWWHKEIIDRVPIKVIAPREVTKPLERKPENPKDLESYWTDPEKGSRTCT